jgi:excisionase family DNA binding protein
MSAYAKPRKPRALLRPEPARDQLDRTCDGRLSGRQLADGAEATVLIDALIERLAERIATAIAGYLPGPCADVVDEWLDSRQAAEYLGLHRDTLRRLAAARAIPSEQDGRGRKLFFRRSTLDEWRRSGGRARHLAAVADAA